MKPPTDPAVSASMGFPREVYKALEAQARGKKVSFDWLIREVPDLSQGLIQDFHRVWPTTVDELLLKMSPASDLIQTLLPAYSPCRHFDSVCKTMEWHPANGHVPRGFCGAAGQIDDVQLVLVVAEPGDPYQSVQLTSASGAALLREVYQATTRALITSTDKFHKNLRSIIDICWPNSSIEQLLRKVWITESVLCSAKRECGSIPSASEKACVDTFLTAQLKLFPHAIIAALGGKAQHRMGNIDREFICAASVAPPGGNRPEARKSWERIAAAIKTKTFLRTSPPG